MLAKCILSIPELIWYQRFGERKNAKFVIICSRRPRNCNTELKRTRRRQQFAYLTMRKNSFAFFIFGQLADVLSFFPRREMTCFVGDIVDNVRIWWQIFNFVFLSLKRRFQFNSRIFRHVLQSLWLWIIGKWLRKHEVTFSDDVLAAVDFALA